MKIANASYFIFIFCLAFTNCGSRSYNLYLNMDRDCDVKIGSRVFLDGKEIGEIDKIVPASENKITLILTIRMNEKISRSYRVNCRDNMLGDAYIEIVSRMNNPTTIFSPLHNNDTLYGTYKSDLKILDSAGKSEVIKKLNDLKNTVDSLVNATDSTKSR